ncbi:hypothetical protein PR048_006336 [Dryococelus australis]|uniref:Uncharacterized protein n=1 Tax=Dryococelus australis TaxID=614101 RepID=A0ABQ9IBQ5_9NEOP|nr:hypothetical protein PR048_006336 [Dryococelus australis]
MDGSNVNLKLSDMPIRGPHKALVLNIVSFGLHILMVSLNRMLKSQDGKPSQRSDFSSLPGSTSFPWKFWPVHWFENTQVVERAGELYPYVEEISSKKASQCSSFLVVSEEFFAVKIEPFLTDFQSDTYTAPSLTSLLLSIMVKFVKKDVLGSSTKATAVILCAKNVDGGYATRKSLQKKQRISLNWNFCSS